ncbi:MAG: YhjD/YihY/BrkB family envelope integrity protein, partial [Janthinobacterium lividum]
MVRVYREAGKDNLGLISAGVAYYGFLTLIPALGALVLSYGLFTDPGEVATQMRAIVQHVPADAAKLIDEQLTSVVHTATGKKGFGLILALLLAVYGAMKGAGAVVTALNV